MAAKRKKAAANKAAAGYPMDDKSWRARDDLRTLSQAQEIQKDKARLAAAKAEAKKQMTALSDVAGSDKADRRKRLENRQL